MKALPFNSASVEVHKLGFALLLGALGLLANLYPLPLFANVQLILGNMAYVIVAVLLGPWYGLVSALLCATGLMLSWSSPHVYPIFIAEALWLGFAKRRDIYALYAGICYWLLLGMPLTYLYISQFTDLPREHMLFAVIKQGVNGLIYISLGAVAILLVPGFWHFKGRLKEKRRRNFSTQLTYIFTLLVTSSLLISILVSNHFFLDKQQVLLKQNLQDSANHLGQATQNYLDNHQTVIANAAHWLSQIGADEALRQQLLSSLHDRYPSFITMLIANRQGQLVAASPESRMLDVSVRDKQYSIQDRPYFTEALYNRKTYLSSVFLGRGFGSDPIVAISAPFYLGDEQQAAGILEGSLDVSHFISIEKQNIDHQQQSIVLVDDKHKVIYASKPLKLAPLSEFNYALSGKSYQTKLDMLNLEDLSRDSPEYIFSRHRLDNGWQLYVLEPFSPLLQLAQRLYLNTFLILIVSLLLAFYATKVVSKLLTGPLEVIASKFNDLNREEIQEQLLDDSSPLEVFRLYQKLVDSKRQLLRHQLELEEKVAIRTHELEQANAKLKQLAEKDSLTGLYNRRYAEQRFGGIQDFCERNDQPIAIAILDLDLFKQVNDNYGHEGGDECLRAVAELLRHHFCRDIDIIARYGGEEFILILPQCNVLNIEEHLERFRIKLTQLVITCPQGQRSFSITTSIGAIVANACFSEHLEDWVRQADIHLYRAKHAGRNRISLSMLTQVTETGTQEQI
ncbi:sensor domain-containing diguanylate cyclase [Shewanella sp. AS16]|uniref:sensor domain-containing diguanylate cyclase n=1 Tax=Shewanella sp. AS16 TaxID=2907625 RepID=UPI002DD451C5|nr:diguanylate cyclase [Shewanella sp. AS16]